MLKKFKVISSYIIFSNICFTISILAQIQLKVEVEKNNKPISPLIYGRNNSLSSTNPTAIFTDEDLLRVKDSGLKFFRENGGNNSTKYNWSKRLSSHPDWYNNVYTNNWDAAVQGLQKNIPQAQGMWAFQLIGKVASTGAHNFNDWGYNRSQWWEGVHQNLAGNGELNATGTKAKKEGDTKLYLQDWPADSSTAILHHWFNTLKIDKTKVQYWSMDNEPEIWNGTHDDLMPTLPTAEEFIKKYVDVAVSARKIYPEIKLTGPVPANEWQWYNWGSDAIEYNGRKYPWLQYFLLRIAEEEKRLGLRLLDVVDLHFYPGTNKPEEITQLHRVFFDENYVFPEANGIRRINGGWDTTQNKEYIFGRINQWLAQYYGANHGRTLAITEMGVNTNDGQLTANWYASIMGEFMKNEVEIFAPWSWSPGMWEVLHLTSNYNEQISVAGTSTADQKVSIYPTINVEKSKLSMLLINKTAENQSVKVNIDQFIVDKNLDFLSLAGLPKTETFFSKTRNALVKENLTAANNTFTVVLKPYSVNMIKATGKVGKVEVVLANEQERASNVFPNPVTKKIQITTKIPLLGIEMIDQMGRKVADFQNPTDFIELPTEIKPGQYFLLLKSKRGLERKKIQVR